MKHFMKLFAAALMAVMAIQATAQHIAVLADVHVTPGNDRDTALRAVVAEINSQPFDLVIMAGDLSNEGSDTELSNVNAILSGITHPLAVIPGNHELTWSQSATKTVFDTWGNDRFVVDLDSLIVVGISCGPYMKMGDGHIKQEDLHWLRSTLQQYQGRRVLSVNHYPLKDDLDNWQDYVNILADFPIVAHINGHYHRWIRYQGGDIEGAMVRALKMGDGDDYGYSIVDIDRQWVHIYNKRLGCEPEAKFAFAVCTEHKPIEISRPEWQQPEGFEVAKVWADSASVFTRIAFDERNIYFGNSVGQARCIDKRSGQQQWSVPLGVSIFSRPMVLRRGRVAFPNPAGIAMVDIASGRRVKFTAPEVPYVADGLMTEKGWVQGGYKRIELRNANSGKLIWEYDSIFNYCQAAPAVDGRDLVFGAWDTNLRCLDLATGRLRWVWNNGKAANMLGPGNVVPVITSDKVFVVAPDRYMTALDRATGRQIWRDNSVKYRESLGHSEDYSRIYAKTMDGFLVAVDATSDTFNMLWQVDLGLGYEHAPCIVAEVDGIVYAGSRRGIISAVDPATHTLLWSLPLGVSEVNGIDVDPATRDIYVSLIEGTIFRISRK